MEEPLSPASDFHFVHAIELKHKRKVHHRWEQSEVTKKEYGVAVQLCRNMVRKAKAYLDLNLARNVKDNKAVFYKYLNSKGKTLAEEEEEAMSQAEEALPYNQLPDEETRYALFIDGSCRIVGKS
ncbi:hypothetical protein WISP_134870 [Willisornis vidua]|uniref:Uncharacterized protein n=1 Tax=Willisornis vidua TaxID=1566151 RepID=A0ABQ9CNM2_9PASS|nr:hypothetical protein WISP_134870 [Willisornis vidua]